MRSLYRPLLPILLGLLAVPAAPAADDLLGIYRQALRNDPVFAQARADLGARREAIPQARAEILPDLRATAAFERVDQDQETAFGSTSDAFDDQSYGVEVTQPLLRLDRFRERDRATNLVSQAEAEFEAARQDLIVRVAERYFGVLDQRETLTAARAQRAAIERQLEQARERFEVGVVARTDVEEAKARFDLATADVLQAENELQNARERLREVTGQPAERLAIVREAVDLQRPEPDDEARWRQRAEENNWQLLAAREAAEAAMDNIRVQRAGHYPTVDLVAGYSDNDTGGTFGGETEQLSIGVRLEVPLYQGGGTTSRVREAQARYTESREFLEQARRAASRSASDAFRAVETALQRVRALDQARTSTRAALDATEAGFEVGTRTVVDVLNAQRDFFDAERDYAQARHAYLVNILVLSEAAGILVEQDLVRLNRLLGAGDS